MPGGVLFFVIASLIVASGIGMVLVRNTVYSALLLVFNFLNVALLYLVMGAPFIAITQITVYAGAIMVLFLFVIMLLGTEKLVNTEILRGQRWLAFCLALVFILEMGFVFVQNQGFSSTNVFQADFVTPSQIGQALFTDYALPFEMVAFILVAAAVGAVLFTQKEHQKRRLGSAAEEPSHPSELNKSGEES